MKKLGLGLLVFLFVLLLMYLVGGSFYMLHYALEPEAERTDTARCFRRFRENNPVLVPWLDSLRACQALRDTFVLMPSGERHHAYLIRRAPESPTAIVLHGWRGCAIDFLAYARMFHEELGLNVLLPDLHAHGLSDGDMIGMGWKERKDVLRWMAIACETFRCDELIVYGVSMGAATTMNVSGETSLGQVGGTEEKAVSFHFIEDCGYTSVWDEFVHELRVEFRLPAFPLMHTASLLCRLRYGWSFGEASPLKQVAKCPWPMLFIHGDSDDFVPSWMVHPLYEAKPDPKSLWVTTGSRHATSFGDYHEEYVRTLRNFILH